MSITGFRAVAIAITALAAMTVEALADKRVALVIGNSAYQNVAKLSNPARDASAIADLFKKAGFDVVSLQTDAGNLEFKRALRRFEDLTRDSDVAVVFYAGHGIEIAGNNYMIPIDAKLASDLDAQDEAITLDRIVDSVEPARQLRLVILDACRDNPFVSTMKRQRQASLRAMSSGLGKVEPTSSGTLVAYAAKAGSTADDGFGENSPFTTALLKHLTVPGLDIRLALGRVRDDVMKITNQRQEPFVYGSLGGATVALVPTPEAAAPKIAAPMTNDPHADARRDYEYFERVGTKEAWDLFLKMHTSGLYAELAKVQRAKLAAAESARQGVSRTPSGTSTAAESVATLSPALRTDPAAPTGPAPTEVARLLQVELARVGCYSGSINGDWNAPSRRALDSFNRSARKKLDSRTANLEALDAVRDQQARVCPLACEQGYRADAEKCVKIVCDPGFAVGSKNTCEPVKSRVRETARTPPERNQRPAPPARQNTGRASQQQQIACDQGGCRPVGRGCTVRTEVFRDETRQTPICN